MIHLPRIAAIATVLNAVLFSQCGLVLADSYTFDSLSTGTNLVGQDNWNLYLGSSAVVATGSGVDTTRIAQSINGTSMVTRTNDANFTFAHFTGSETAAVLQFDAYIGTTSGGFGSTFGVGHGIDIGPQFGIDNGASGQGGNRFYVREPSFGTEHGAALSAVVQAGDWVRLRLTMDLTANSGDGAGSLSFADLTSGTGFVAVSGLQNIDLKLGNSATSWDELFVRLDDFTGPTMAADNLSVEAAAAPLPSAAWGCCALLGAVGLIKAGRRA